VIHEEKKDVRISSMRGMLFEADPQAETHVTRGY
jgi:hypothetical protein